MNIYVLGLTNTEEAGLVPVGAFFSIQAAIDERRRRMDNPHVEQLLRLTNTTLIINTYPILDAETFVAPVKVGS